MKNKIKSLLKGIIFIAVFLMGLICAQNVLIDKQGKDYQKMHGFFEEPANSLDAVFIGSSSTYAFWNPATAWAEKGIAVYSMSNASQPFEIAQYLIDDARKTQPDALYIINATRPLEDDEYSDVTVYRFKGSYPATLNKFKALNYIYELSDVPVSKRLEYMFPIIQFHDRWNELEDFDYNPDKEPYKSASRYSSYLKKTTEQEEPEIDFSDYGEINERMNTALTNVIDYCKTENVKVLFVVMPQAIEKEKRNNRQNTVVKILEENGFDVLDLREKIDEIGLDYKTHFYDEKHTNIHGSIRITDYISDYLIENYGFTDKRGSEEYSDWDKDCSDYYDYIAEYLLSEDYNYLKTAKVPETADF